MLEQRLHFAGDALPVRGVDSKSRALGRQHPRAVHDLGGGSEGSIGGVRIGFGHGEILLDLRVADPVGAQLEDRIDLAGSVGGHIHTFAAGRLAAGIFNAALHAGHVGQKGLGGRTEITDHREPYFRMLMAVSVSWSSTPRNLEVAW